MIAGRPTLVADRPERGDGRLADERVVGSIRRARSAASSDGVAARLVFAARPRRHLDDGGVVVVQRAEQVDVGMACGDLGGPSPDGAGRDRRRDCAQRRRR